jgi:uncharacterized protein
VFRDAIADYIRAQANPPEKLSHQPRLYQLAAQLAEDQHYDDDVLYAAAWLHDLGVFFGHRPEDPAALASWDNVAYAAEQAPALLRQFGFPAQKIPVVVAAILTHQPSGKPTSFEGVLLRDADILEQLGAIGILRTVCKIGRDTRFVRFTDALRLLQRNADQLPAQLHLPYARRLAESRLKTLQAFLDAAQTEAEGIEL